MPFPLITSTHTDIWVEFWNTTFKTYIESLGGGAGGDWPISFIMEGRIVSSETDDTAPTATGTPSLAVRLPSGGVYSSRGVVHTLDDDVVIGNLPANFTGWLGLEVNYDTNTETYLWEGVPYTVRPEYGTGILGKIVSTSNSVAITVSDAESDIIPTYPLLLSRLSNGYYGTGTTGGSYNDAPLKARVKALEDRLAALEELLGNDGTEVVENESSIISSTVIRLESYLGSKMPEYPTRTNTTIDHPRYAGHAQQLEGGQVSTDIRGGGNATIDFERNSIHG